jgi:hypothetical protein
MKGVEYDPLAVMLCSPSIQQSYSYKMLETGNHDDVLTFLQSWRGDNVHGEMADSPYVQSKMCAGICDGSQLVRGSISFYLLQSPAIFRKSVF